MGLAGGHARLCAAYCPFGCRGLSARAGWLAAGGVAVGRGERGGADGYGLAPGGGSAAGGAGGGGARVD